MGTLQIVGSIAAAGIAYGLYKLYVLVYNELAAPIRSLPGPKGSSWLLGNLTEMFDISSGIEDKWVKQYGPTFQFKGPLGFSRLYTIDPKAMNHILMDSDIYQKPLPARRSLANVVGPGLLVAEGDVHKNQRRIMNPAFGPAQIRDLTEIFVQKAIQLRDIWTSEITKQGGVGRIDVLSWLSRMTLDVIGLAGFNYHFNALNVKEKPNELNEAFSTLFQSQGFNYLLLLQTFLPIFGFIRTSRDVATDKARGVMSRIGAELLSSSKAAVARSEKEIADRSLRSRNLLSLLVRANAATGIPEHHRLSEEVVIAQISTFLVAGHETTSTATTWALYALSQHPDMQTKLRDELLTVSTETPTMDELNALPYLDCVVRETLRVHSPVPGAARVATADDVIPLSYPVTDSKGVVHHSLTIKKGQTIRIPILSLNTWEGIWGEDADEFKPDRWQSPPASANSIPGVWSNQMTFLGGPHACIGYRFSLVEMKALLFTLIRAFEFELAVPPDDIVGKAFVVQRPLLKSDPKAGNVMPLLIKPYRRT